jgi:hypothetical protein
MLSARNRLVVCREVALIWPPSRRIWSTFFRMRSCRPGPANGYRFRARRAAARSVSWTFPHEISAVSAPPGSPSAADPTATSWRWKPASLWDGRAVDHS